MAIDHKDGGYKSRKMVMAYSVIALIFIGFLLTGYKTGLSTTFSEYCMALLGAAGIYAGSNSAIKWMASRGKPIKEESEIDEDGLPPAPPTKDPHKK